MIRSNSPEPLTVFREPQHRPVMCGAGSPLIEGVWRRLTARFEEPDADPSRLILAREAFALALYAASAAIATERADTQALGEAAMRVEAGR